MDSNFSERIEELRKQAQMRLNNLSPRETEIDSSSEASVFHEQELYKTELKIQHEELQRAYSQLSELYEEFWELYEFAPCGYVTLNQNGIITRINQKGVELLGALHCPLTYLGFSRFIAPKYQSLFFMELQTAKTTLQKQSVELPLVRRNQSFVWVHLDIEPRVNQIGEVEQWRIILTDITSDKEREKANAKANRLELITNSIQGGIAYVDVQQRYRYINQTYLNWLEQDEAEILGKTAEEVLGNECYASIRHRVETVLNGESITYECKIRSPSLGKEREVLVTLVPDWNELREVEGFYALITDISKQKEKERKIREQEQFLRSIYEGVQEAIFVVDVSESGELRWVDLNPIAQQLIGVSQEEAIGKSLAEISALQIRQQCEYCITSGHGISYENCVFHQGTTYCWLIKLTPLKNEQGKIDRLIGTGVNIDHRRELESTLRQQAEREKLLNSITQSMRQSLDLQEVVQQTLQKLLEAFAVSRAVLAVASQTEASFELVEIMSANETEEVRELPINLCDYELVKQLFTNYKSLVVVDVETEFLSPRIHEMVRVWGARSLLAMPIWYDEILQGVLCLQMCGEVRNWKRSEQQLVKEVCDQLAIALRQSQLYKQLENELAERSRLEDQLRYEAAHDQLTDLPNRLLLMEFLEDILQAVSDHEMEFPQNFAVLFLDLNRFKAVNDSLGHNVGDQLLIIVAERLQNCLRENDLLVRFGGDEFVILLHDLQEKQAAIEVANRIHEVLATPIQLGEIEITIGTSIGIVFNDPNYTDASLILRDADIAMYEAKNKNLPYVIFNEQEKSKN